MPERREEKGGQAKSWPTPTGLTRQAPSTRPRAAWMVAALLLVAAVVLVVALLYGS